MSQYLLNKIWEKRGRGRRYCVSPRRMIYCPLKVTENRYVLYILEFLRAADILINIIMELLCVVRWYHCRAQTFVSRLNRFWFSRCKRTAATELL